MLVLTRKGEVDGATLGILRGEGFECCTLEDRWRNNLPNLSCIPKGRYVLKRVDSPHFGDTFEVMNVPGRSKILIHAGNTIEDTEGCILLGSSFGRLLESLAVIKSREAFKAFMAHMAGKSGGALEIV